MSRFEPVVDSRQPANRLGRRDIGDRLGPGPPRRQVERDGHRSFHRYRFYLRLDGHDLP
jgi:hypothetical protein